MQQSPSDLTASVDESEWAQLRRLWPSALRRHVRLEVDDPFLTGNHQMLVSDGRRAEICYIAYRQRPETGLLLQIKTFYPRGAYRLPTGGVQVGEDVQNALTREVYEETGLHVGTGPDQAQVRGLAGVLSYELAHAGLHRSCPFATYHFLVEFPPDAALQPQDASERIEGWLWRPPDELPAVADTLAQVGDRSPAWADWGRFRALSHRFVAEALG